MDLQISLLKVNCCTMEEIHRKTLRQTLPFFLENLKVRPFVDLIYSSKHAVLSNEDYDKILAQITDSDKICQIVLILQRSGPKAFDVFIHSLKTSGQEFIAEELEQKRGKLKLDQTLLKGFKYKRNRFMHT